MASVLCLPYSPAAFDTLPEFEEAHLKTPLVEDAAVEARELFRAHGFAETAGLCLLHKHFSLSEGEVLVEEPVGNTSFIRPARVALTSSDLLPYMFRLTPCAAGEYALMPLEYAPRGIVDEAKLASLVNNSRFINELGALVHKHKGLEYVGLTLMHREHILSVDGGSIEFTDHKTRELLVMPASAADAHEAKVGKSSFTTRTVWTFGERKGEDKCTHCTHCGHTR